jgi:type VI secretion system FHA domain protein
MLLLDGPKKVTPRKAPSVDDLAGGSPLDKHFQPPAAIQDPALAPPPKVVEIPHGYNPLAPDDPDPPSIAAPYSPAPPLEERAANRPDEGRERAIPRSIPPARVLPPVEHAPSARDRAPIATSPDPAPGADFADVLAGAGLDPASVTPEIARDFGQILRVVVSGVMDVMRSRQQIKDEFRMQGTRVRRVDNNPLKFSADVDDALHNLLLKRNAAYMSPVEAFEDAFADLRNHQIAMLAGMRTAFESMLAEFDPDRLQEEFDRQLAKGLVPAKMRYWDSYRERQQQAAKDPEATFRRLFGEEFARAYEDQLRALKSQQGNAGGGSSKPPKPPET